MARILVIEDNPTNLQLMAYLLRAFGHTVLEAQDGEPGLVRAAELPDLILCDVHLPGLDGYQVARYLKSHPVLRSVPLVAVTALAMVGDRDRVMEAGFDGYLPKPIEPEAFVRQVEAFLIQGQPGSAPARHNTSAEPASPPAPTAPGPTVLVVDNLPVNMELARRILEPFGYRVLTARGVPQALAAARAEPCDLILSDMCMSGDTGYDLLTAVLADPGLRSIPVVFITSTLLDSEARARALAQGAARYLVRPIEPEALLAEIEACLREVERGEKPWPQS
ncbi:MAG: divK 2 [Armatimonadetes bacterium]|jgi:two-component system cell cycle response regulator|nr:divK 2 [Armatimonadota bacterium]